MKLNDQDGDEYILDSGRKIYANNGILGIDNELRAHEGYDGFIGGPDKFTAEERREISDYAIALWERFKEWK